MILSPLGDTLQEVLKIDTHQFGMVVSGYAFAAGISGILAAGFADKFDRKKLLLFFYLGFIIGTAFCALATSFETLLAARILTGLFGGVIGSISMAIVADIFEPQLRGRVMGMIQMAFAVSQIAGIPAGLILAKYYGWHSTFWMIVGLAAIIYLVVLSKLKPVNQHLSAKSEVNAFKHLIKTISNKNYQLGLFTVALISVGGYLIMPFGSSFLRYNIHLEKGQIAQVFLASGLASAIVMPTIGRFSDKINRYYLFLGGTILAMIMVLYYTNLKEASLTLIIVSNIIMFAGIMGRIVPAMAMNSMIPGMTDRGAYMSLSSSLQQIAGGIGAWVAGLIVHRANETAPLENYNVLGYVVCGVMLVCLVLVYRVSKLVEKPQ